MKSQTTNTIMMVRPAHFGFNLQTAENNTFQTNDREMDAERIKQAGREDFDGFVAKLRQAGINVIVVEDNDDAIRPDAVFPNNWITFHHNGTIITFPMFAPSRQAERREDVIDMMRERFDVKRVVRFEAYEASEQYLEGTGSMILDRVHRKVYACVSPRTDAKLLDEFCHWADYEKVEFHAQNQDGVDIYHTNVMMAVGDTFVVICMDSVRDEQERKMLRRVFKDTRKDIINISPDQMNSFAGNMLQVQNMDGETFLVMSEQAFLSLSPGQIEQVERHTRILHAPIYTIEKYGGGSARCMMAEVFLDVRR